MLEKEANRQEYRDMIQWRNISQDGINELWKEFCGKMEEEVLEKYRAVETSNFAYRGVVSR